MACVPIDLNDQAGVPPEEIHDVVEERYVHFWLGKAVSAAEREESLLELAPGRGRAQRVARQHRSELPRSWTADHAADRFQILRLAEPESSSLVDGALQVAEGKGGCQIQKRPGWRGDRQTLVLSKLPGNEHGRPMHLDPGAALPSVAPRHDYLDNVLPSFSPDLP